MYLYLYCICICIVYVFTLYVLYMYCTTQLNMIARTGVFRIVWTKQCTTMPRYTVLRKISVRISREYIRRFSTQRTRNLRTGVVWTILSAAIYFHPSTSYEKSPYGDFSHSVNRAFSLLNSSNEKKIWTEVSASSAA